MVSERNFGVLNKCVAGFAFWCDATSGEAIKATIRKNMMNMRRLLFIPALLILLGGVACQPQPENSPPPAGDPAVAAPAQPANDSSEVEAAPTSDAESPASEGSGMASGVQAVATEWALELPATWRRTCVANLRIIDGAKQQWAIQFRQGGAAQPTMDDLFGAGFLGQSVPKCPAGGGYTVNIVDDLPSCSHPGHDVPDYSQPVAYQPPANEEEATMRAEICAANREKIDAAKIQWMNANMDKLKQYPKSEWTVLFEDVFAPDYLEKAYLCPDLGYYFAGLYHEPTVCTHPGHGGREIPVESEDPGGTDEEQAAWKLSCRGNLERMLRRKQEWSHIVANPPISFVELKDSWMAMDYTRVFECEAGGLYSMGPVNENPTCSCIGHTLTEGK